MKIMEFEEIDAWQKAKIMMQKVSKMDTGFIKYPQSQLNKLNKLKELNKLS